mgnify:CR=1 FL=1
MKLFGFGVAGVDYAAEVDPVVPFAVVDLAGDYQAWQNDQVRLFDALALVLGMAVPDGRAFEQIDDGMEEAAQAHLSALAAEYQRRLLSEQFEAGEKEG